MSAAAAAPGAGGTPLLQVGRTFVSPGFDYLVIGGALSLLVIPWLPSHGNIEIDPSAGASLPLLVLLFNSAHFASSTVRLYTKPGARRELPFLTMGLPLVVFAVVGIAVLLPGLVGQQIQKLYLTWSPYHYAAQAYGLALMYAYRSGCRIGDREKRALRWICLLPFLHAAVTSPNTGLAWFVPESVFQAWPLAAALRTGAGHLLSLLTFVAPVALVRHLQSRGQALPAISLLVVATNGVWWVIFSYMDAFVWATVFHGLQYLAIVTIFHLRDHGDAPETRFGWLPRTLRFYGLSLVLGYALFNVWPYTYVWAGLPLGESILLVAAAINIHHFIVDAYIWRLSRAPDYKLAVAGAGAPA